MSRRARETIVVDVPPDRAEALWTDLTRWSGFVEGFARVVETAPDWPAPGARVVWESIPGGRGRVTETVAEREPGRRVATTVDEERLTGTQTLSFEPLEDGATLVEAELEYELSHGGPFTALADVLFIRRALSDALARSLQRFAVEAAVEGAAD